MSSINPALLRRFFQVFSRLRVVVPTSKGNQYEFFTFLNVCLMAKRARLRVSMTGHQGKYVVRSSPGNLGGPYGYAILTTQNSTDYELHNGIEIDGQSGMKHEADILLLGARGTAAAGPPRSALLTQELMWAAECKLYSASSRLKGESRKAVGVTLDFSLTGHSSRRAGIISGCLHCGMGFEACFVTNVRQGLRPDIEDYLDAYRISPLFGVLPKRKSLRGLHAHARQMLSKLP